MIVVDPNKAPRVYTETEQRDIAFLARRLDDALARLYAMEVERWQARETQRIPGPPPEGSRDDFADIRRLAERTK